MTFVKVNHPVAKTLNGFVNDIFDEFPSTFGKTIREDVFAFPPVNITDRAESFQLEIAAPGLEKNDFNIKLDGNLLTISADKKEETKDESVKTLRKEFSNRSFKRSFTLDEKIESSNIAARYENGILVVNLPKKEEVKAISKEITIQ